MEGWLESTFSCLQALFTCLFILTQLGLKLIYMRSSSHWAKLSRADTSVSSVTVIAAGGWYACFLVQAAHPEPD